jgi:hypothetical protein
MTLEEEILAVETVVQVAHGAATEHLGRAEKDLHLGSTGLLHYKDFLDGTLLNASATLARSREMASAPAIAAEASSEGIVRALLASVRESVRLMYVAMTVLEQFAGARQPAGNAHATAARSCSFCGKTEAETRLVAGPAASICASCTRLACGVLGITCGSAP